MIGQNTEKNIANNSNQNNTNEYLASILNNALQHGIMLHKQGALEQASNIYLKILAKNPQHLAALYYLSIIATTQKNYPFAINLLKQAIRLQPKNFELYTNLGIVLQLCNNLAFAKQAYNKAITCNNKAIKAYFNLAGILQQQNLLIDAIVTYHKVIKYQPDNAVAWYKLGLLHHQQQRYTDAIDYLQQAIKLAPDFYQAYNALSICFKIQNKILPAINAAKRALELCPKDPGSWYNLGLIYIKQNDLVQAIYALQQACAITPNNPDYLIKIGEIFQTAEELIQANNYYQQALALNPNAYTALFNLYYNKRKLCDWQNIQLLEHHIHNAILKEQKCCQPFIAALSSSNAALNQKNIKTYAAQNIASEYIRPKNFVFPEKPPQDRLIIGYLYGNNNDISLKKLLANILLMHDPVKTTIKCYSYEIARDQKLSNFIQQNHITVVDISNLSDHNAAQVIYKDKVAILVDLHCNQIDHRRNILKLRPAPIQVNYLNFIGSSGLDTCDYIITDKFCCDISEQEFYTEKFAYLQIVISLQLSNFNKFC